MKRTPQNKKRWGVIAPLTAVLMIPLLGMAAFSIDVGYIILCQTELQNAADAAALAGADRLQDLYVDYNAPGADQSAVLTQATTNVAPSGSTPGSPMYTAEQFSNYNVAGGVNVSVPDSDVVFGYTDANGNYSTSYTGFPNTIDVTTRRDDIKNTPVSLFFGPVFNKATQALTAHARATIYVGDVSTLQKIAGVDAHILPVALDYQVWNYFATTGKTRSGLDDSGNPTGYTNTNSNGKPQLHVYPEETNTPGSFGLIDVGPPQNNAPAFRTWIDDGETPNDIQYLVDNNKLPVSPTNYVFPDGTHGAGPKQWKCGPGMKSTLLTDFQAQIGKPNLIPLFEALHPLSKDANGNYSYTAETGNGQNATYAVCGFVGVTVSYADGHGSNMDICIQPHGSIDPTTTLPKPRPAGTESQTFFSGTGSIFVSAKLTK